MIFDQKGKAIDYLFLETNPSFEKQISLKNVKGKTMRELIPEHEEFWFKIYGEIALTGRPKRFQKRAEKLDNSWFDVYAYRVGDETSRKVVVLFHNITRQKQKEKKLLRTKEKLEKKAKKRKKELIESTELLQTVFDTTDVAIAVFQTLYDSNGVIKDFLFVRINKALEEMYSKKNPLGYTYTETSKHGVGMGIFDALKNTMKTGEALDTEFFFDKEGFNHWFRLITRRQNDLLIASFEDITKRKSETQKLEETMRFNEQLVQTSPDTILIINLNDYQVRYINQDMLKRAGMTKERILGMALPDILPYFHPRDREKVMDFHRKILKSSNNEIQDIEFRVKTKSSNWEWFHARGKIFNRKSKTWVDEYVVLVRNITEQKNIQRALINAEKLSIQGEVARTFAHELRNPLASIGMANDLIKKKLPESQRDQVESYFKILSRSTKVINNLITDLLNSANYSPVILRKEDLAKIVNDVVNQAADRIYLVGIKIIINFKGPYYIMADKEKLEIAILNIIINASEATIPDEGVIELNIEEHKSDFKLSITDNGHGLEKEQIDKLFNAFYTNKTSGLGIGLSSVKNILDEHDAHITVCSIPKKGTTFNLFFHNTEMD